ncbi:MULTISPECIES: DNA adenine methylase [unclassified Oceanispirochaeta]|uniref:DNA adenine methylase n=1 Tax=unclassified Oceanispirochaeta TaxID=2635722 RepID=UPI001C1317BF|nr:MULTISPECIES: DNA adenine methylase [unclassified Oceanispirochaeta]
MNPDFKLYPQLRFMGNKYRLLPWIEEELSALDFHSVLDAFTGSASVSYLFKTMGRQVYSNDFLNFPSVLSRAVIENPSVTVNPDEIRMLSDFSNSSDSEAGNGNCYDFIKRTYEGIFYNPEDLEFLDLISWRLTNLNNPYKRSLVMAALIRSCAKKQPRGVFTISGDLSRYDDGRRDLKLSLREHFTEQIEQYNNAVFDNGEMNKSFCGSVFDLQEMPVDLVYMDPPYVPRSDDNCYVKRYHFLEGLSKYWKDEEIMYNTKVRKIHKKYTPFSYRGDALEAFEGMFRKFSRSILVLSYSSNGYPDLDVLVSLMEKYKSSVEVRSRDHRYHFGTHDKVRRSKVQEYLIIGR